MRIRVLRQYRIEEHGVMETYAAGSVIDVGKTAGREMVATGAGEIVLPKSVAGDSSLMARAREFQFSDDSAILDVSGHKVTRADIHRIGGPDPGLACPACQEMSWLSRLTGSDCWQEHGGCQEARVLSGKVGEEWSHLRQNFLYAAHTNPGEKYIVPKAIMVQPKKGMQFMNSRNNDPHTQVFLRQMAQVCVYDVIGPDQAHDRNRYDFAYVINNGEPVNDPGVPMIMYGHDLWKRRDQRQALIDALEPEIIWTPFYASWEKYFRIPASTELRFRPVPASRFFARPDLVHKDCDLLSVGAFASPIYAPRKALAGSLRVLDKNYTVRYHHAAGASRSKATGRNDGATPYGSAWSAFLSRARFVIFGPIAEEPQPVFFKFYEALGSGAIPIMPNAPDLDRLGVEEWKHYIPLKAVWTESRGLDESAIRALLDRYEVDIANRAVLWYQENADPLLFGGIGDIVRDITQERFPHRGDPSAY